MVVTLDLGAFGDDAADRVAAEEGDGQLAGFLVERLDRPGVLVAVLDPVVIGVGITGVVPGHELRPIAKVIAILVAPRLTPVQGEVMALLPAVGDAVMVAVLRAGHGRKGQHRQRSEGGDQENLEAVGACHFESSGLVTSEASTRGVGKDHAPFGPGRAGRTNRLVDPEQIADQDVGVESDSSPLLPSEDPDPEPDVRSPPEPSPEPPPLASIGAAVWHGCRFGCRVVVGTAVAVGLSCAARLGVPPPSAADAAPGAAVIRSLAAAGPARLAGASRATLSVVVADRSSPPGLDIAPTLPGPLFRGPSGPGPPWLVPTDRPPPGPGPEWLCADVPLDPSPVPPSLRRLTRLRSRGAHRCCHRTRRWSGSRSWLPAEWSPSCPLRPVLRR